MVHVPERDRPHIEGIGALKMNRQHTKATVAKHQTKQTLTIESAGRLRPIVACFGFCSDLAGDIRLSSYAKCGDNRLYNFVRLNNYAKCGDTRLGNYAKCGDIRLSNFVCILSNGDIAKVSRQSCLYGDFAQL